MSERYFELPADPSLEYYRKQAKQLHHAYTAGDLAAVERAVEVLGDRVAERFLLTDAQFVLAQEYGFRTWAEFRAGIEARGGTERRSVFTMLAVLGADLFERQAEGLLHELGCEDSVALLRLRAHVPRHADATDAGIAELRDARLIIARELGFPTWRDLLSYAAKARHDSVERERRWRQLKPAINALREGDTDLLAGLTSEQADSLLCGLASPENIPGVRLGRELGVPRPAVDVLLGKTDNLELPLVWAARHNRVEYVRLLLDAGADHGTPSMANTPLEHAIYFGNTEVVDLLAERGIAPSALWTYAACGRLDLVEGCFDADGGLRPETATPRPEIMSTPGSQATIPATDDPEEIVGEAFVLACQHGRTRVVRWFLDHGVHPDTAPRRGRTPLQWAIPSSQVDVIRLLIERGADPSIRGGDLGLDADGWLHLWSVARPHDPTIQQIHDLLQSHQAPGPK